MRHAIKARFSNVIVVFLLKFKGTKENAIYQLSFIQIFVKKKLCIHLCVAVFPHHLTKQFSNQKNKIYPKSKPSL